MQARIKPVALHRVGVAALLDDAALVFSGGKRCRIGNVLFPKKVSVPCRF
jgi:hypothetical protein